MLKIMIPENWIEKPHSLFCLFIRDLGHVPHVEYQGTHITNLHSDSSYPNIFFSTPTLSTYRITHIYRSTGHRIMVHVEGL